MVNFAYALSTLRRQCIASDIASARTMDTFDPWVEGEGQLALALEGRTFLYRYGSGLKIRGRVAPGSRLEWTALSGPSQGKSGVEQAVFVEVRPNLFFISWIEDSGRTASQAFDLDVMTATTYVTFDTPNGRQGALDQAILEDVHS